MTGRRFFKTSKHKNHKSSMAGTFHVYLNYARFLKGTSTLTKE